MRFFFFPTYFVSCNGPCAPKEKRHRKEHIIIIIIIIKNELALSQDRLAYFSSCWFSINNLTNGYIAYSARVLPALGNNFRSGIFTQCIAYFTAVTKAAATSLPSKQMTQFLLQLSWLFAPKIAQVVN